MGRIEWRRSCPQALCKCVLQLTVDRESSLGCVGSRPVAVKQACEQTTTAATCLLAIAAAPSFLKNGRRWHQATMQLRIQARWAHDRAAAVEACQPAWQLDGVPDARHLSLHTGRTHQCLKAMQCGCNHTRARQVQRRGSGHDAHTNARMLSTKLATPLFVPPATLRRAGARVCGARSPVPQLGRSATSR